MRLSAASKKQPTGWLVENGPRELELLFRAIVYYPSAPILIADNDRHYRDASSGARKLLGLSREKIIGRSLDDFVEPSYACRRRQIRFLWVSGKPLEEPVAWYGPMVMNTWEQLRQAFQELDPRAARRFLADVRPFRCNTQLRGRRTPNALLQSNFK